MNGDEESLGHMLCMDCEALSDYDTASIIAELEKRRPCIKCCRNGGTKCAECFWHYALITYSKKGMDNFKEEK